MNPINKVIASVLILSMTAAATHASAQNLLVNGGFETGDFTGWMFTPNATAEPTITPGVAPFDGSNAFRLNTGSNMSNVAGGGTLTQTVNLVGGQMYFISGKFGVQVVNGSPNADGGMIGIGLDAAGGFGTVFGPLAANETRIDGAGEFFVASATGPATFTVTFSRTFPNFSATPALYHYVDDLSVTLIPEPSAWTLLAAVGTTIGVVRRMHRRTAY